MVITYLQKHILHVFLRTIFKKDLGYPNRTVMETLAHVIRRCMIGCSREKLFTKLVHIDSSMALHITVKEADSCSSCIGDF